ncbi:nitroreductase [Thermosinus carboxydivorans Nor1]|uniref:Nitroreductase n=1 Tax=Thermosinus carboxydivorans Nor1 TaxID=401526 RepID=A1HSM9_9FIRM|nr:nitroreductase family protein [Thermosinus carboxydivorans]EAX46998.1 nitroreductase [Thermosinus carboxydivorans Nor1]
MLKELVRKNRSYRRFYEDVPVSREVLLELVDHARLSPSGANRQAIKYVLASDKALNERIFATLGWAAYLPDWPGPAPGERPAAYIVMVEDKTINLAAVADIGIAAQTIMLAAVERGLGGCMIANIQRKALKEVLALPDHLEIVLVLALGRPKEEVVIDEIAPGGDIKYWRDERQVHHVPKRKLAEIVIG